MEGPGKESNKEGAQVESRATNIAMVASSACARGSGVPKDSLCQQRCNRGNGTPGGVPRERMTVVYNGIDVESFAPGALDARAPEPFISGFRPLAMLYAGGVNAHKGVHTAVEALIELKSAPFFEALHLRIVGGWSSRIRG